MDQTLHEIDEQIKKLRREVRDTKPGSPEEKNINDQIQELEEERELKEERLKKQEESGIDIKDIPFVIVTMNRKEATELINEDVFKGPNVAPAEKEDFKRFKTLFSENTVAKWLPNYGRDRDDWKPHNYPQGTIREFILGAVKRYNNSDKISLLIRPQFFSNDFLAEDDDKRLDTWDQLSKSGCVLIVDAVSIFHPIIYQRLLQSEMSSNHQIAIAMHILSPDANKANELIEAVIESRLQRAFARFDRYEDPLCELDIRGERDLRRWLVKALPKVAYNIRLTPHFAIGKIMEKRVDETHDMVRHISGRELG